MTKQDTKNAIEQAKNELAYELRGQKRLNRILELNLALQLLKDQMIELLEQELK